jgi:hypothetical protein
MSSGVDQQPDESKKPRTAIGPHTAQIGFLLAMAA